MDGYYFLRVKKDYATAVIEDLQKLDAVELLDSTYSNIPEWQQKEVLSRLKSLNDNPESSVSWEVAMKRIEDLAK